MKWKRILICISLSGLFLNSHLSEAWAQNSADINKTISELTAKIVELQGQENSLSKQLKLISSNIELTTAKISATKAAILKLTEEVNALLTEIERIEQLLTRRSELVLKRIPESYKRMVVSNFGQILFSQNFFEFLGRAKYVAAVQEKDAQLLYQLKVTQNNFSDRKDLRERKRLEQEQLKKQLEVETFNLDRQKKEKEVLLAQTFNSEAVYQKLLFQALAERQALERALVEGVKIGPVKKGDPIALVGNTGFPGCSTGAHLHFEIRKGGSWVNAEDYLMPKEVDDQQTGGKRTVGSGSWDWPLEGPVVTQHYGKTPYSWRYIYSGGIHTGVDMISNSSSVIRALKDGTLFSSSQVCGGSSVIKIKYIDHGEGLVSFYLHVQ